MINMEHIAWLTPDDIVLDGLLNYFNGVEKIRLLLIELDGKNRFIHNNYLRFEVESNIKWYRCYYDIRSNI